MRLLIAVVANELVNLINLIMLPHLPFAGATLARLIVAPVLMPYPLYPTQST